MENVLFYVSDKIYDFFCFQSGPYDTLFLHYFFLPPVILNLIQDEQVLLKISAC